MASPSRLPSVRGRPAAGGRSRPMSMIEGPMLNLNLEPPKENGTTSKPAKRRSLLPQFTRKVSAEDRDGFGESEKTDNASSTAGSVPASPRKAMEEMDRRAMPPPSRLTRPTSTYGAGGLGRAPSTRSSTRDTSKSSDARADALAKLTGSAPSTAPTSRIAESGLKRTPSTRLPQGPSAQRGLARTTSVRSKEPHTRTSTSGAAITSIAERRTSASEKRTSSSKPSRPPSIDSSLRPRAPSIASPKAPASPASSTTSRQSLTRTHMPPPARPTFSTYQQHYSPAKSALPKPPIPSTRPAKTTTAAAVVTEVDAPPVSFEVAKQQIELLQLSLLHQASAKTMRGYDASAKRKLGRKQAKLRKEHEGIRAIEMEQQRTANLIALDSWCHDPTLLAEHLQILSKVYTEVSALIEEGSRYAQLIAIFESWAEDADPSISHDSRPPAGFLDPLPPEWRKSHTSLALRLRALQRELEVVPQPPRNEERPSSLELLLGSCRELLDGMFRELELMTKLEKGLLEREKKRVEDEVKALTLDGGLIENAKKQWVPAWQNVT